MKEEIKMNAGRIFLMLGKIKYEMEQFIYQEILMQHKASHTFPRSSNGFFLDSYSLSQDWECHSRMRLWQVSSWSRASTWPLTLSFHCVVREVHWWRPDTERMLWIPTLFWRWALSPSANKGQSLQQALSFIWEQWMSLQGIREMTTPKRKTAKDRCV